MAVCTFRGPEAASRRLPTTGAAMMVLFACHAVIGGDDWLPEYPHQGMCYPGDCIAPQSTSIPTQYSLMSTCLTGPQQLYGSGCGCADLTSDNHVSLDDFALFQNFPLKNNKTITMF